MNELDPMLAPDHALSYAANISSRAAAFTVYPYPAQPARCHRRCTAVEQIDPGL